MNPDPTLYAVFLTGLLGGVHCAGMCGGIVGAISMLGERAAPDPVARPVAAPLRFVPAGAGFGDGAAAPALAPALAPAGTVVRGGARRLGALLPYNAGRLVTYTSLGAAAGAVGSFGWLLGEALPVQQAAFAATNVLLVAMGLYVAGWKRLGHAIEAVGAIAWRRVRPLATASLGRPGPVAAAAAGALWGLVPCGMVYAVLAGALLSGSAANGAALMLAFGLGTLPNLLALGLSGRFLARFCRAPRVRLVAGAGIAGFGLLGLARLDAAANVPILEELCVRLPGFGG